MTTAIARTHFKVGISPEVLTKFPETKVAFLLAKISVTPKPEGEAKAYLEEMKKTVIEKGREKGITAQTYRDLSVCRSWQIVFNTFNVDPEKKSTIEMGLSRLAKECDNVTQALAQGKKTPKPTIKRISNFVDFYNLISWETLTPMGALDLSTIEGNIELRYGKEGEKFSPLGKTDEIMEVKPEHIVYADGESILTHLWNYRDAKHCCVPDDTKGKEIDILLFADQAHQNGGDAEEAIFKAAREINRIGGRYLFIDVLSSKRPEGCYDLSNLHKDEVQLLNPQ